MVAEAGTFVINPALYPKDKLPFDIEKDFIPITGLVRINHVADGSADLPANNVAELIELAKKKPGEITYGTAGIGSGPHMNIVAAREHGEHQAQRHALSRRHAGDQRRHGRPHQPDVGQRQPRAAARIRRGKIKMLGIGSEKRLPQVPDIPTIAETGNCRATSAGTWFGLVRHRPARRATIVTRSTPTCATSWPSRRSRSASWRSRCSSRWRARRRSSRLHPRRDAELGEGDPRAEAGHRHYDRRRRSELRRSRRSCPISRAPPQRAAQPTARGSRPPRRRATARARPRCRAAPWRDAP